MMKLALFTFALTAALVPVAHGQPTATHEPPCEFSGALFRTDTGTLQWYSSEQMKARAIRKVDLSTQFRAMMDLRSMFVVDVLVDPESKVHCVEWIMGVQVARASIESALHQWVFIPQK